VDKSWTPSRKPIPRAWLQEVPGVTSARGSRPPPRSSALSGRGSSGERLRACALSRGRTSWRSPGCRLRGEGSLQGGSSLRQLRLLPPYRYAQQHTLSTTTQWRPCHCHSCILPRPACMGDVTTIQPQYHLQRALKTPCCLLQHAWRQYAALKAQRRRASIVLIQVRQMPDSCATLSALWIGGRAQRNVVSGWQQYSPYSTLKDPSGQNHDCEPELLPLLAACVT
jgi:hypothetical protein